MVTPGVIAAVLDDTACQIVLRFSLGRREKFGSGARALGETRRESLLFPIKAKQLNQLAPAMQDNSVFDLQQDEIFTPDYQGTEKRGRSRLQVLRFSFLVPLFSLCSRKILSSTCGQVKGRREIQQRVTTIATTSTTPSTSEKLIIMLNFFSMKRTEQ